MPRVGLQSDKVKPWVTWFVQQVLVRVPGNCRFASGKEDRLSAKRFYILRS